MQKVVLVVFLVTLGLFSVAHAAPPSEEDPCSAPFWFEYTGDGLVGELTVELRAATDVVHKDNYFLKLLDKDGKAIGYIKLLAKSGEEFTTVYDFEEPISAASIRKVELFSLQKDVDMQWMRVSGKVGDETYVFFDHECPGMVIGPGGCKRMRIH